MSVLLPTATATKTGYMPPLRLLRREDVPEDEFEGPKGTLWWRAPYEPMDPQEIGEAHGMGLVPMELVTTTEAKVMLTKFKGTFAKAFIKADGEGLLDVEKPVDELVDDEFDTLKLPVSKRVERRLRGDTKTMLERHYNNEESANDKGNQQGDGEEKNQGTLSSPEQSEENEFVPLNDSSSDEDSSESEDEGTSGDDDADNEKKSPPVARLEQATESPNNGDTSESGDQDSLGHGNTDNTKKRPAVVITQGSAKKSKPTHATIVSPDGPTDDSVSGSSTASLPEGAGIYAFISANNDSMQKQMNGLTDVMYEATKSYVANKRGNATSLPSQEQLLAYGKLVLDSRIGEIYQKVVDKIDGEMQED